MQFDTTTIAVASLIVTFLGVVATLAAPKFVSGARLTSGINSVDRISRSAPSGDFRVELYHKDTRIEDDLFVVRGHVTNVGSRDIVRSHFVDPVDISTDDPRLEILSLDASSADGVMPSVENVGGRWKLKWSIVKPKEKISITAVIRSSEKSLKISEIENGINVTARLVDVKSGKRLSDTFSVPTFVLVLLTMSGSFGGLSYWEGFQPLEGFDVSAADGQFLVPSDAGFKLCKKSRGVLHIANCEKILLAEALPFMNSDRAGIFSFGVNKLLFLFFLPFAVIYAALFGFMVARPRFIVRFAKLMSLSTNRKPSE